MGDEFGDGFHDGRAVAPADVGVEGVDYGGLPGCDFCGDGGAGFEFEVHGYLAEGRQPGEFAVGLKRAKGLGVAHLEVGDGRRQVEGIGV